MPLLFFLLIWPLAEIWLMIKVGQEAGALNTLMLIIATAALGLLLVQLEWRRLSLSLQTQLRQGREPLGTLIETAAVGLAGILLFIPGFISDFLGLVLLLPVTRKILIAPLKNKSATTTFHYRKESNGEKPANSESEAARPSKEGRVLEGEYQRKDDNRP